jgi:hypothetical protein
MNRNQAGGSPDSSISGRTKCYEIAAILYVSEQVILGHQLFEFNCGQRIFAALLEYREIELMSLPVIQIDRSGFRNSSDGLEEQHAFRHLNPARGDTVADCQKYLHHVRNIGVLGQAKLFGCEQRFEA